MVGVHQPKGHLHWRVKNRCECTLLQAYLKTLPSFAQRFHAGDHFIINQASIPSLESPPIFDRKPKDIFIADRIGDDILVQAFTEKMLFFFVLR